MALREVLLFELICHLVHAQLNPAFYPLLTIVAQLGKVWHPLSLVSNYQHDRCHLNSFRVFLTFDLIVFEALLFAPSYLNDPVSIVQSHHERRMVYEPVEIFDVQQNILSFE